ncbi:MAG TPA: class I SAM-dependent methyltransferase [Streptosporangiaceae bacterium]|nr:class I SAM-dependent methyltransferase [Streptosporangiaceae bacterium]
MDDSPQIIAKRAASFGTAAAEYARYRPDYPLAAIRWLLAPLTEAIREPRQQLTLLDLGAGTGKLTAQLAELTIGAGRPRVTAVEPDPEMLAELRRQLPDVTAMPGRAEAIPLAGGSVDAVLAGQSAHWFDLDRAIPEIARVLRPGGVLGAVWNADDSRTDWVAGLHRASGRRTSVPVSGAASDDEEIAGWLGQAGQELFWPAEGSEYDHSQLQTADSMIATLGTHSAFLIMEPEEREAALTEVRNYLAATPQTASGEFRLPMRTLALRAVRR